MHYQTLGVTAEADDDAIRDAYRRLARQRHPDVPGGSPTAMARLNEAYRVLGDPARRAVYDASLREAAVGSAAGSAAGPADVPPGPTSTAPQQFPRAPAGPAVFPWKFSLVLAGLGAAAVLVIAAMASNAPRQPIDFVLEPGSCVVLIETDRSAGEVPCDDFADYRVNRLVPFGGSCPGGTTAYRDREGGRTACVERIPADE